MPAHQQSLVLSADLAGAALAAIVRTWLGVSWAQARRHVESGKVFVDGARAVDAGMRPRAGQTIELRMNAPRPRGEGPAVRIVHDDPHVVVVDKPAGVSSVPYEPREIGTAMDLLRAAWRHTRADPTAVALHVVHRIDKATSGLLAFAKTKRAERGLAAQLRAHTMDRVYVCAVHGRPRSQRIESRLVADRGDGLRGSTRHVGQGKRAVTHVEVIEELAGAALCRVTLETGKTHQIRIHLAERGHPLIGETVYIRDYTAAGGEPIASPRLLLHAATLGFAHPVTGARILTESPLPADFTAVVDRLREPRRESRPGPPGGRREPRPAPPGGGREPREPRRAPSSGGRERAHRPGKTRPGPRR